MKNAKALATTPLVGENELRRRAATLRRLAGGLRAQLGESVGWERAEIDNLASAASLLDRMAVNTKSAAGLVRQRVDGRERRQRLMADEVAKRFGSLTEVADRVAFVGAVCSQWLRARTFDTPGELDRAFDEAIGRLAETLAYGTESSPRAAVEGALTTFAGARDRLRSEHAALIGRLEGSART